MTAPTPAGRREQARSEAVVFNSYGDAEVLHTIDVAVAEPGPSQVRVRVRAAGVQPFDALFRSGAAQQWLPARFPQQLGNEFAGEVDAVGPDVSAWSPGDAVLGWAMLASYAEHVIVRVDEIVAKPQAMPWVEAAVLSASGQTAATAIELLAVRDRDVLLVHAAAGGVGTFAVQIAAARGATVIGTASEPNHQFLRDLGAIPVSYGNGLAERVREIASPSVALDASGTVEALRASLDLVPDRSRIGTVAFQPAAAELGVRRLSTERSAARLAGLVELNPRVVIQATYPLGEASRAHREIETGHVRGKLVLEV
jgi:enoyl reductase